jgi:hypothetical protein
MATVTIEKPVETRKYDDIRRLVDGPDNLKAGFTSVLAARMSRWADRYAAYQMGTDHWKDVRI